MASLLALGLFPGARRTPFPALALWGLAFGFYAGGAWVLIRAAGPAPYPAPDPRSSGGPAPSSGDPSGPPSTNSLARPGFGGTLAVVWSVAVAGRLALVFLDPHFSDDLWRYLWDGHVQLHGVNAYLHPPAAEALSELRTSWHGRINHPAVPTIYPPGAQLLFAALAAVGTRVLTFKTAWVAADLAAGWLVGRLARRRGADPAPPLLLYLWSPLLLVEVAWSGHLAPLGLLPMMAAIWYAGKGRSGHGPAGVEGSGDDAPTGSDAAGAWAAGGLLGFAAAVKFAPAAGLPALARSRGARAAVAFLLVAGLAAAPFLDAGSRLWAGLAEYVERWSFHPGPFRVLEAAVGGPAAKAAGAAAVAGLALRAARERWSVERALFWTIGAALLLTPTLHPWYLLWILPFAALRRRPGWILFTGTAVLSYAHLDAFRRTGEWPQPVWLGALIWAPPLAAMAWTALRSAGGAPGEASPCGEARRGRSV